MDKTINALLAERAGYERRGLTARVADVDVALALLGHKRVKTTPVAETAASSVAPETATATPRPARK